MAEVSVVINDPKTGKSLSKKVELEPFMGKVIGDKVLGSLVGLDDGYELEITGGSDHAGFPMRRDIPGTKRKRILAGKTVGIRKVKGQRIRKLVAGNTIYEKTAQINIKIVKYGKTPLFEQQNKQEENKQDTDGTS